MDFQYFYKSVEFPSKDLAGYNIQFAKEVSLAQTYESTTTLEVVVDFCADMNSSTGIVRRIDKKLIAKPDPNEYNFLVARSGVFKSCPIHALHPGFL